MAFVGIDVGARVTAIVGAPVTGTGRGQRKLALRLELHFAWCHDGAATCAAAAARSQPCSATVCSKSPQVPMNPGSNHVPQKSAKFGNKDRLNRPHGADFSLGSLSFTVPENRSVVS